MPSYPKHRGESAIDAVIIGGGLTGCATAYAFAAAGIRVALLESDRIGRGSTGFSSGWIGEEPGASFLQVERSLGLRAARRSFQAWRRASLDFIALLRRLDVKCHLTPQGSFLIATSPESLSQLRREHKGRRDAELDAPFLNARQASAETGIPSVGAIKHRDGALVDPYRAALGLAAAAQARGATIFEDSPAKKVTFTRKWADVYTAGGSFRTRRVIVTTGIPTPLYRSLARHFWFNTSFMTLTDHIPAKIRQRLGSRQLVIRDLAAPPHVVRWVDDERMLVAGADADAGKERLQDKLIVQRTGQLMYELSTLYPDISGIQPQYGWAAPYVKTEDGLPFIGPHRNFPHHLFAWGGTTAMVTGAYLASRILLRHHLDEVEPADEVFAFRLEKRS